MRITVEQMGVGDRRLRSFVEVPWVLHHGDPHWTPPLRAEFLGSRLFGMDGLLTSRHPYHRFSETTHFVARDGRQLLGRITAAVNQRFNDHYSVRIGFFGLFEVSEDYGVAEVLLDRAKAWFAERGMDTMRGPGGYSNATHEPHQGVLVEGFDTPPTVELTHNPPYYGEFLERYGLSKAKDYVAYLIRPPEYPADRLERVVDAVKSRRSIETRPIDMRRLREEVDLIVKIYNEAWADTWGFLPMTDAEGSAIAAALKLVADPGLIRFASVDGELAAVFGAMPDPNVALRPRWNRLSDTDPARVLRLLRMRRRISHARLMFFGVRPQFRRKGIDAVLYLETVRHAIEHGYETVEPSMLLEDNDLILRASRFMGGVPYKRWRIYEMPIHRSP